MRHGVAEAAEARPPEELRGEDAERAESAGQPPEMGQLPVVAAGLADHEQPPRQLGGGDQAQRLRQGRGHRLLPEHRQAQIERLEGDGQVGGGHGHVDHGVWLGGRDHGRQVGAGGQVGDTLLRDGGPRRHGVEVDDAGEGGLGGGRHGPQPCPAHRAGADHEHPQRPAVRRHGREGLPRHDADPVFSNQPASLRAMEGSARSPDGAAQVTALAMTRRTSGWW